MSEFVECSDCGFVLYAGAGKTPEPKKWEYCPDCESTEFEFTSR